MNAVDKAKAKLNKQFANVKQPKIKIGGASDTPKGDASTNNR